MDQKLLILIVCYVLLLTSCKKELVVAPQYFPRDSHESYNESLRKIGLEDSKLYDLWVEASQRALTTPVKIKAPFQESFVFTDSDPNAFGYRFDIKRGQKVELTLTHIEGDSGNVYLDLYRIEVDSTNELVHIASADTINNEIIMESAREQSLILRVQPELLNTVHYNLKAVISPSLEFPVSGKDKKAIGSLFGVPRDAGRRVHEGIDIFARRHTPLISVSDGYVNFAGIKEGSLGGKVIWARDTLRDLVIYYAHLEDVYAVEGEYIYRGDTIGTVGNSGNASTTYPHLHFGIYDDGAVDPYPYVVTNRSAPAAILSKPELINSVVRVDNETGSNRNIYSRALNRYLSHNQYAKVVGVTSTYYKVITAEGDLTYLFYDHIENIEKPIRRMRVDKSTFLLNEPNDAAVSLKSILSGEIIEILAYADGYTFCRAMDGTEGWMKRV